MGYDDTEIECKVIFSPKRGFVFEGPQGERMVREFERKIDAATLKGEEELRGKIMRNIERIISL